MTKSELRKAFMLERRALTSTEHAQKTNSIVGRLFRTINLSRIQSVHCFISMRQADEIDTARIFERLWSERPTIATFAPRIDETTSELETVRYAATTELKANKWSINEPVGIAIADPGIIDLVVVPLLCFDERGHRVGYGKGYYDRFLQRCRHDCIKAGLSLFPPVDRIDDVHSGDVPLDVCITPDRSYSFDRTN